MTLVTGAGIFKFVVTCYAQKVNFSWSIINSIDSVLNSRSDGFLGTISPPNAEQRYIFGAEQVEAFGWHALHTSPHILKHFAQHSHLL